MVDDSPAPHEPDTLAFLEEPIALANDVLEVDEQHLAVVGRDPTVALLLLEPAHGAEALKVTEVGTPYIQVVVHLPMLRAAAPWQRLTFVARSSTYGMSGRLPLSTTNHSDAALHSSLPISSHR